MMKSEFQGQTVLVTGAASGIGRLMALRFADLGARLALVDVNGEGAEKLALELRSNGVGAWAFTADLADIGRIRALPDEVKARAGAVDVLVNNAGVVFGGRFDHVALDRHLLTHRINSEAMMAMTHVFLPQLLQSRAARIVNIASGAGFIGVPFGVSYAASKWAAVGFSESLRQEFLELGVDHVAVTTVCPGYIDTGMFNGVKISRIGKPMRPEYIVEKIMAGVIAREAFVKEPFVIKTTELMRALTPAGLQVRIARLTGLSQSMKSWRGRA